MNRFPWILTACLVFTTCCSASTCAIGTTSSPTDCQITTQAGQFTWTISDIQIAVANVNVNPGVLTLSAVAAGVPGADQLQLVEQVTPPTSNSPNIMPLVLDLQFDVSVAPTGAPTTPGASTGQTSSANSETQTYLNGFLLATVASQGLVPAVAGVPGTFLDQNTTVAVNESFIGAISKSQSYTESFAIADPGSGITSVTPAPAPEPASFALIGLAAIAIARTRASIRRS